MFPVGSLKPIGEFPTYENLFRFCGFPIPGIIESGCKNLRSAGSYILAL